MRSGRIMCASVHVQGLRCGRGTTARSRCTTTWASTPQPGPRRTSTTRWCARGAPVQTGDALLCFYILSLAFLTGLRRCLYGMHAGGSRRPACATAWVRPLLAGGGGHLCPGASVGDKVLQGHPMTARQLTAVLCVLGSARKGPVLYIVMATCSISIGGKRFCLELICLHRAGIITFLDEVK